MGCDQVAQTWKQWHGTIKSRNRKTIKYVIKYRIKYVIKNGKQSIWRKARPEPGSGIRRAELYSDHTGRICKTVEMAGTAETGSAVGR